MRLIELRASLTKDRTEYTKSIISRYWDRHEDGQFIESVASIAEDVGESTVGLLEFVRKHCTIWLKGVICPGCSEEVRVDCRSSYIKHVNYRQRLCDSCRYGGSGDDEEDDDQRDFDASEGAEHLSEKLEADKCSVAMDPVVVTAPVKVFSGLIIDLESFNVSPAEAVAACQGATLAVVKDGVPLFYCVSPSVMAEMFGKGG